MASNSLSTKFKPGQIYSFGDLLSSLLIIFVVTNVEKRHITIHYLAGRSGADDFHPSSIFADRCKLITATQYTTVTELKQHHPELFI